MSQCRECEETILFGRTRAGKLMPLNPEIRSRDDALANLAVYKDHTGRLNVRVLKDGEQPEPYERRGMPHFATCVKRRTDAAALRGEIANVIPLPKRRPGHPKTPDTP